MAHLRLLRPDDGDWVHAGFAELGEESRYRRFFTAMPRLPDGVLQRLLNVDAWNHLAIAAEAAVQPPTMPQPIGIARFVRLEENADTAEAAVAVVDHMQGRGLGKLLLSVLTAAARERGVKHFRAEVLNSNDAMRALLRELDRDLEPLAVDGSTATYDIALPEIAAHESVLGTASPFSQDGSTRHRAAAATVAGRQIVAVPVALAARSGSQPACCDLSAPPRLRGKFRSARGACVSPG